MIFDILRGNKTRRWPLLERATRDKKLRWLETMQGMVATLWVVSLLLTCSLFAVPLILIFVMVSGCLSPIPSFLAFAVLIVATAISTAHSTRIEIQSEGYSLLCLTSLADEEFIWSYVLAGIYKVRILFEIIIGLAPPLVLTLTLLPIASEVSRNFNFRPPSEYDSNSPLMWLVLGLSVWSICMTLGILGLTILTAALSVGLTLWNGNDLIGASFTLAIILPIASFVLLGISGAITTTKWNEISVPWLRFLLLSLPVAILPYFAVSAVARFSERWARRPIG